MRKSVPLVGLVLGIAGLGWWANATIVPEIERDIEGRAAQAAATLSRHGVQVAVSGRDVEVSGLAHSEMERMRLVEALKGLDGVRDVRDTLDTLDIASPYSFIATKDETGALRFEGVLPDAKAEGRLRAALPPEGRTRLDMASGEPNENWVEAIEASLAALTHLQSGSIEIRDTAIRVAGLAPGREDAEAIDAMAPSLPLGYAWVTSLEVPPSAIRLVLDIDANEGIAVEGDLPGTFGTTEIAAALGIEDLTPGLIVTGAEGDGSDLTAQLSALRPLLPAFETARVVLGGEGVSIEAAAQSDISVDALRKDLEAALPEGAEIALAATTREFPEGHERVNAVTGEKQSNSGGFWYPVVDFVPSEETCTAELAKLADRVGFAGGSEFSAPTAPVLTALTMTIVTCLYDDDLMVEVTRTGAEIDDARQAALAEGLVQRGVPADRVVKAGARREVTERVSLRWIDKMAVKAAGGE